MSMQQQEIQKAIKRKAQKKDLLIEVRAKAFQLQNALSDLMEYSEDEISRHWMAQATEIYEQSEDEIKGA